VAIGIKFMRKKEHWIEFRGRCFGGKKVWWGGNNSLRAERDKAVRGGAGGNDWIEMGAMLITL
jgi:hypothetical protein